MGHSSAEGRICDLFRLHGWTGDPKEIPGLPGEIERLYPGLSIVADGRPCAVHRKEGVSSPSDPRAVACPDCFVDRGRGTTAWDLFGMVPCRFTGIEFPALLSVKTAKTKGTDSKPSQIDLSTGTSAVDKLLHGAVNGGPMHTLIWASASKDAQNGWAVCLDVAPFIREAIKADGIPLTPRGGWGDDAPAVCLKRQSRPTGTGVTGTAAQNKLISAWETQGIPLPAGKWMERQAGMPVHLSEADKAKGDIVDQDGNVLEHWEFPCYQGLVILPNGQRIALREWVAPYMVRLYSIHVHLPACGITQESWTPCTMADLPAMVADHDWSPGDDIIIG